jgi:hypothetical protein
MKSINLIQFKNKIPLEKLNSTKTKKKKKKTRQSVLFSKWLKNTVESELKNNKMLEDEKNNLKKRKKNKEVSVNFVNGG